MITFVRQAKLIASCQSAIELARHLHSLLVQDEKMSKETARTTEVSKLVARYESLLARARSREQQIRDIRYFAKNYYFFESSNSQKLNSYAF